MGVLLASGAGLAIVLGTRSSSPRFANDTRSVASVRRRDLIVTDTEPGTLSYADPQTVYDRISGTVTWLPSVGQVIKRGRTLFEIDDEPVILLYGARPAYRDLDSSDRSGPDIGALNANLVALGYSTYGISLNDTWQTATTDAVKALQKSLGETETGKLSLGQVIFLPGKQLINTVDSTVGSPTSFENPSSAILQTSSTRLLAIVDLAASAQSEAVVGSHVTVEMPDRSTVHGTITSVSPVAESSANSGGSSGGTTTGSASSSTATVPVTITLDGHVKAAGFDQAPVSVHFAQANARHVLSVPVTALVAILGHSYAVQEAAAPHRLLPVGAGLFAAGYVQISGPGIYPGLKVTDSQG